MTFVPQLPLAFKDFDKFFVGFDDQMEKLHRLHADLTKNIPNYPPYNIRKTGDNTYVIEVAVAGFAESEIELTLDDGKLTVKGNAASADDENNFLWRGIANRAFTRTFALDDQIEIQNAEMLNGMLKVFLERIIPEEKKAKKVEINKPSKTSKKRDFLTESDC